MEIKLKHPKALSAPNLLVESGKVNTRKCSAVGERSVFNLKSTMRQVEPNDSQVGVRRFWKKAGNDVFTLIKFGALLMTTRLGFPATGGEGAASGDIQR